MNQPTLLQLLLGYSVMAIIFGFGMYATNYFFQGHRALRIMFWSLVVLIYLFCVLPMLISGGTLAGMGIAIAGGTALGTYKGIKSKDAFPWGQWGDRR